MTYPSAMTGQGLLRLQRFWPLLVAAAAYALCSLWAARLSREAMEFLERQGITDVPTGMLSVEPFIRRDLHAGLPYLVYFCFGMALGAVAYRGHPPCGRILLWSTLVLSGRQVWRAAVIQAHNDGTFWAPRTPRWGDFGTYLADPAITGGEAGILILAVFLAVGLSALGERSR